MAIVGRNPAVSSLICIIFVQKYMNPHQPFRHEYCCELFGARRPGPASFHAVFTWYDVARGYTHATWGET